MEIRKFCTLSDCILPLSYLVSCCSSLLLASATVIESKGAHVSDVVGVGVDVGAVVVVGVGVGAVVGVGTKVLHALCVSPRQLLLLSPTCQCNCD